MNTHRAIIECSVPPGWELIASGPYLWCLDRLTQWLEGHPPAQYSRAYVVKIETEVFCEPGVGVYAVTGGIR